MVLKWFRRDAHERIECGCRSNGSDVQYVMYNQGIGGLSRGMVKKSCLDDLAESEKSVNEDGIESQHVYSRSDPTSL